MSVATADRPGFALLGGVQATLIFTIMVLSVPLPLVAREFGLGPSGVLLLSAAYGLSFSALLLLGGRLTDRHGGRRMLRVGLVLLAAASIACALAPGYPVLLASRFAQGVGAALAAPAAVAVVRALYPEPARYRRAMATWGGLSVLGATAGNLLSGAVAAWVSWRWLFAAPVLVALIGLARSGSLPPAEPAGHRRPGLDLPGAALATAGVCAASYGLVASTEHGWRGPEVVAPLAAGLFLLLAFAAAERRTADPLLPPGFLADRHRATALAAVMATAAGTALTSLLLALYLQQVRGWGVLATSAAFLPYAGALLAAGRLAGPLAARYGPVAVTAGGLAVAGAGLGLLARLAPGSGYVGGLLPGLLLLPAGAAAAFAGAAVLATGGVPPERTGLAAGVLNTAMELGPTTGVAALMALAATRPTVVGGYAAAFAAAAVGLALTALAVATLARRSNGPVEAGSTEGADPTKTTSAPERTNRTKEYSS
ncbi:putative MFS family arabinose efflux permease [Kitasatospora sp. MAA19]|uniref:MFS transporter n=1 Tax=Kitasatospora sp. MAA19 TaxID=3035090 RepID=UPI002475B68D|nr:MFS transporter [Kitasatospora sp. MAA19]MDH6711251.1 putative MFS family arabinose efflux permease [Kitasatospora sp. MAA19]